MTKAAIVITSISPPTEAVKKFSEMQDHTLIVVGDRKSPPDWQQDHCTFLSVADQELSPFSIKRHIPYNHYCRKMIGYLYAIKAGNDVIIDTDDDNIPHVGWRFPDFHSTYACIPENRGFINVYSLFSEQKIWPRGFPLRHIGDSSDWKNGIAQHPCRVGVWQGLADEDPDVDAIYRLIGNQPCTFTANVPHVLKPGTISPFNSQNTAFSRDVFALLYLPAFVSFRFTDILRGLVAQPILWRHGYQLGFTGATVTQKRNPHDYMKDFIQEVSMYLHCERIPEIVASAFNGSRSMADDLLDAYRALHKENIVDLQEMSTLEAWLSDLSVALSCR